MLRGFVRSAREPRRRSLAEFAEQEIIVPKGPAPGRFRMDRQPFARLFFAEIESGRWTEINVVGCVQSGKTLIGFVIITLYHLFEIKEAVICGVPKEDIAKSKWLEYIRPVIAGSRYAAHIPLSGEGSKEGARVVSIYFGNGASLRFMSGGGGDAARASETARVVVITETSKMDVRAATSQESNKVTQLKARTKAFDAAARVYMESTPTVDEGLAWHNHLQGSQSKICLPCPHCKAWVVPTDTPADRETLVGWKEAKDAMEAKDNGTFACPHCKTAWTEEQRRRANLAAVLIHKGQKIEKAVDRRPKAEETPDLQPTASTPTASSVPIPGTEYVIVGAMPRTRMLGFRWSAINNMLRSAGSMAAEEWSAAQAVDEDDAMRAIHQNLWTLPYKPEMSESGALIAENVQQRVRRLPRGVAADETTALSVGIDLGKYRAYYVVLGRSTTEAVDQRLKAEGKSVLQPTAYSLQPVSYHVVEYGCLHIASPDLGLEKATLTALREFRDRCAAGWPKPSGGTIVPLQVWIDTNYADSRPAVIHFCKETNAARQTANVFRPLIGRGEGPEVARKYTQPSKSGNLIHFAGLNYHLVWFLKDHLHVVECNVDYWKSWVHDRLNTPAGEAEAITLYEGLPAEHLTFAKHLTSERRVQEFSREKGGVVMRWERLRANNHYFDAVVYAAAANHYATLFLEGMKARRQEGTQERRGQTTPDGRPFLVTAR